MTTTETALAVAAFLGVIALQSFFTAWLISECAKQKRTIQVQAEEVARLQQALQGVQQCKQVKSSARTMWDKRS